MFVARVLSAAILTEHFGVEAETCDLVIERRISHQVTGEPVKFLTLADGKGMVETELFAATPGRSRSRSPCLLYTGKAERKALNFNHHSCDECSGEYGFSCTHREAGIRHRATPTTDW